LIGKGRAAELLLTGRLVSAEPVLQMGLVNEVVEPEELLASTESLVREIVSQSPLAVRMTWEVIHRGLNLALEESALLGAEYFGHLGFPRGNPGVHREDAAVLHGTSRKRSHRVRCAVPVAQHLSGPYPCTGG